MRDYGPVIAIGKPGESLPVPGAYRLYVEDDAWRDVVADLLAKSGAAILRAGDTPGLRWEFQEAFRHRDPRRNLILLDFPRGWRRVDRQRSYEEFLSWVAPIVGRPLLKEIGDAILIYFDQDGAAQLLQPGRSNGGRSSGPGIRMTSPESGGDPNPELLSASNFTPRKGGFSADFEPRNRVKFHALRHPLESQLLRLASQSGLTPLKAILDFRRIKDYDYSSNLKMFDILISILII